MSALNFGEWHYWRKESPTRDMEGQTMLVSNGESYALCDWCEGGCWADNPFNGFRYNDEIEYWVELPDIPRRQEMKCDHLIGRTIDGIVYVEASEAMEAIAELKQKLEDVQASMYCDVVDANMENRRLRRALWIARAKRAIEKIAWFKLWNASISTMNPEDGARQEYEKWKKNLGKFLKKAEEYK